MKNRNKIFINIFLVVALITTNAFFVFAEDKNDENDYCFIGIEDKLINSQDQIDLLEDVKAFEKENELKVEVVNVEAINDDEYKFSKGDRYINLPIDNAEYIVEYNAVLENQEVVSAKKRFIVNFENNDDNNQDLSTKEDNTNNYLTKQFALFNAPRSLNVYVANYGDDTNGDGSESNPYASISKAYSETVDGGHIILLSDILTNKLVGVWHSITIESKQGQGPYVIKRAQGFELSYDIKRGSYYPAMFELHSDNGPTEFVLNNIILDDDFKCESTAHDAIIAIYEDPNPKKDVATLILGNNATVKNFGGISAIRIEGSTSKCVMEKGSKITNDKASFTGVTAVYNIRGTFIMNEGAEINGVTGSGNYGVAVHSINGKDTINGTIINCVGQGDSAIVRLGGNTSIIGPTAKISKNQSRIGTIYILDNSEVHIYGEISENKTVSAPISSLNDSRAVSPVGVAVYAVNQNSGAPTVYIEEGAKITDNVANLLIRFIVEFEMSSPFGTTVLANNVSNIVMNSGTISNNKTPFAVMVRKNGLFKMEGGQISSSNYGIALFNEGSEVNNARVLMNGGTIDQNSKMVAVFNSNRGYQEGSYVNISESVLNQGTNITYTQRDGISLKDGITILPSKSSKQSYFGATTTSARNAFNNIYEIKGQTILATWFESNGDDVFKMDINGLNSTNDDVFVCLIPLKNNGTVVDDYLNNYIINPCDKTINGSNMTIKAEVKGNGNNNGYAFALFTNPALRTITYRLNGGKINGNDADIVETYNRGQKIKTIQAPTRQDYDFLFWESNNNNYNPNDEIELLNNMILSASWKQTIRNVTISNDGNGTGSANPSSAVKGTKIDISASANEGYKFKMWQLISGDITIDNQYNEKTWFNIVSSDVEIKANFERIKLKVEFDSDGGDIIGPQELYYGEKAVKPKDPTKPGCSFAGWYLGNDEYDFNTQVKKDITLKAKWVKNRHAITFRLDGGNYDGKNDDITTYYDELTVIKIPKAPTKDGYKFLYWQGSVYYPGDDYTVTKPHTFTAIWGKINPFIVKPSIPRTGIE